jgi:hypothetical protein
MLDEVRRAGALDHVAAVEHLLAAAPPAGQVEPLRPADDPNLRPPRLPRIRGVDILWARDEYRWRPCRPDEPAPRRWER